MICLCPRLQMVSGYCQHRICTQCLYNEDSIRKPSLDKCPTCQKEEAFPVIRYFSDCRSCKIWIIHCTKLLDVNLIWYWFNQFFYFNRPAIPEDIIEIQRCLGVRACPHSGCTMECWEWEMEEHLKWVSYWIVFVNYKNLKWLSVYVEK